jgi:predicted secreted protein
MAKSKKNKNKPKLNLTVREEQRNKLEQMFGKHIAFNLSEARRWNHEGKVIRKNYQIHQRKTQLIPAVLTAKFCRAITKHSGLTDTDADPVDSP